jgi:acyl dehydratase
MSAPWFEDFTVGDVCRSRIGRAISEADNTWFTALTHNTNQLHFNAVFAQTRASRRGSSTAASRSR